VLRPRCSAAGRPSANRTASSRNRIAGARSWGHWISAPTLLTHHASKTAIKRPDVVQFLDQIARESTPGLTTVVVLDNASIHHNIDQETIDQWFLEHRMVLFYLPPYSPELNRIETLWKHAKYHWRRFVTWTKETIDAEIENLLGGYGVPSLKFVSHEHLMTIIRLRIAIAHSMPSVGRTAATAVLFNWRRLAQFNRSGAQRRSGNVLAVIVALALMNRPATGPCSGTRADNASL
jgi:transposase